MLYHIKSLFNKSVYIYIYTYVNWPRDCRPLQPKDGTQHRTLSSRFWRCAGSSPGVVQKGPDALEIIHSCHHEMSTWKVGGFLPPWRWANEAISIMKSDEILMFDWLILVERMSNPLWIEIINELTKPVNKPWNPFVKPLINYGFMVCLNQFSFDACSLHPVTETGLELWVSIVELLRLSQAHAGYI